MRRIDDNADGSESIVFLGDMFDRGQRSDKVLTWLFELSQTYPEKTRFLMGNHERMMLDFIDDPAGRGAIWLWNGGLETLASFGVILKQREADADVSVQVADALEASMPAGMQEWLRALPLTWSSGNMHCVHAAMSPRRPPSDQRPEVMLWGHPDFLEKPRQDGQVIVHGHTIVPDPLYTQNRISIDTGVYRTGRLTAARVERGKLDFITAT